MLFRSSMAIGKGTDVAMDVAQITLMSDDLLALPEAVKLSQKTVHVLCAGGEGEQQREDCGDK